MAGPIYLTTKVAGQSPIIERTDMLTILAFALLAGIIWFVFKYEEPEPSKW